VAYYYRENYSVWYYGNGDGVAAAGGGGWHLQYTNFGDIGGNIVASALTGGWRLAAYM